MREFDLNIEKVLDHWTVAHAIREIISNALDEQVLSGSQDISIYKENGVWHIRDYGRGLEYYHFTQNENEEKLSHPGLIGKFGVGLKDALATFFRHGIDVSIDSKYGHYSIGKTQKHGFDDLLTLHAYIDDAISSNFVGTDFCIKGCSDNDMERAKAFFLCFSNLRHLETVPCGAIYEKRSGCAEIFINGVKVAEEENFLFSYNITSINAALRKALNRERTNVGRSAYSERIRAILLSAASEQVIRYLSNDLGNMSAGTQCDELKWIDVQVYAVKLLNSSKEVVFATPKEVEGLSGTRREIVADSSRDVIYIPTTVHNKIAGTKDVDGNPIVTVSKLVQDYNDSFEYDFVDYEDLNTDEKHVADYIPFILELVGSKFNQEKIKISNKLQQDDEQSTLGIYDPKTDEIIILRSQLSNRERFFGTLIHELSHQMSGWGDASRGFETQLTSLLGRLAEHIAVAEEQMQYDAKQCQIDEVQESSDINEDVSPTDEPSDYTIISAEELEKLRKKAFDENKFEVFGALCRELLRRNPLSGSLHRDYSIYYLKTGLHDMALEEIDEAISLSPHDQKMYETKAVILTEINPDQRAISFMENLLTQFPESASLYNSLAGAYYRQGKVQKSLSSFERAATLAPDDVVIVKNYISTMMTSQSDWYKGIELAEKMIERHPEEAVFHQIKALAFMKLYRYEKAFDAIQEAIRLEPDNKANLELHAVLQYLCNRLSIEL